MLRTSVRPAVLAVLAGLALSAPAAYAVNLVPNPSFETYTSCPTSFSQVNLVAPWDTPSLGTSDFLNACAPNVFPSVNVPANEQGFQSAHTGVGYAGLIPYSAAADYREYITAPLTAPLAPGTPYTVRFWISLADSSIIAIDRMGAYLSVGPVGPVNNYFALPYTPQIETPVNQYLTNASGWTLVSGTYVAVGGEDHITIGNYHNDANTNTTPGPGQWIGGAYYYIDDVSVEVALPTQQACCMSDGSCSMQFPGECTFLKGTPAGPGTTCTPSPCGVTPTRAATWGSVKIRYR